MEAIQNKSSQACRASLVCHCFQVTEAAIRDAIDVFGAGTVLEVTRQTRAGGGCTACRCRIQRMLDGLSPSCSPFALCSSCGYSDQLCECKVA